MICCPTCQKLYSSESATCSHCGFTPALIDGFPAWAPELAADGAAYKLEHFSRLAVLEESNFWFQARNSLICWAMQKYQPSLHTFLEIGCGTGFVISSVSKAYPEAQMAGSEISSSALRFAAERVPRATFMQMDARHMPFFNEFDAVGIFDVLEHIPEDEDVLRNMHYALKRDGIVFITVPQHPFLWSESDVYWSHVRRYTQKEIESKVVKVGFNILRSTSFISLLLPLMTLSRRWGKENKTHDPFDELRLNRALNRLLRAALDVERGLIKAGLSMPMGGSRLIVARKGK